MAKWQKPLAGIRAVIDKICSFWRRRNVVIDMGASTVRVYLEDKGVIVDEPCVVALDRAADRIVAVGQEAYLGGYRRPPSGHGGKPDSL